MKLPLSYYLNEDVVFLAKDLIGKVLCTSIEGEYTSGIITETEAYAGVNDKASHAYGNRFTERTKTMYEQGGISYVYLCYGIHHLFNVVSNTEGVPHAILIRGIQALEGIKIIKKRRNLNQLNFKSCIGPGKASQALRISTKYNASSLLSDQIWIEDRAIEINDNDIKCGPRIGIDYAEEDALLPYRFWISSPIL